MSKPVTLLIVDDNEDDQNLCRRALRQTNYTLATASTAEQGLATATGIKPDLILLDYNLPDLNGLGFMERLDQIALSVPIVMMTGEGSEAVAVDAMKRGAGDYLIKDTAGHYLRLLPGMVDRVLATYSQSAQARRLSNLHQAIVRTVADGILGVSADGNILFTNPAAERMLRCPASELIGQHLCSVLRQADGPAEWNTHPLSVTHDGTVAMTRDSDLFQRRGGTSFPVSYTASSLDFQGEGRFGWVLVFQDITERKKVEEELIHTAHYDTLTGLPNRVMFHDYLSKALSRAERSGRHLSLLFLDLDDFKVVNDTLGHMSGDQLLQLVAQRLVRCVRAGDLVSRLGGDEFSIVVEDGDPEQIDGLAHKIMQVLDAPYQLGAHQAEVSASIGIAIYPECGADAYTLIESADNAMYVVKRHGKKGHFLYKNGRDCLPRDAAVA